MATCEAFSFRLPREAFISARPSTVMFELLRQEPPKATFSRNGGAGLCAAARLTELRGGNLEAAWYRLLPDVAGGEDDLDH